MRNELFACDFPFVLPAKKLIVRMKRDFLLLIHRFPVWWVIEMKSGKLIVCRWWKKSIRWSRPLRSQSHWNDSDNKHYQIRSTIIPMTHFTHKNRWRDCWVLCKLAHLPSETKTLSLYWFICFEALLRPNNYADAKFMNISIRILHFHCWFMNKQMQFTFNNSS